MAGELSSVSAAVMFDQVSDELLFLKWSW